MRFHIYAKKLFINGAKYNQRRRNMVTEGREEVRPGWKVKGVDNMYAQPMDMDNGVGMTVGVEGVLGGGGKGAKLGQL